MPALELLHGLLRGLSKAAVEGKPMACPAQGPLKADDLGSSDQRPLEPDRSDQRRGGTGAMERSVGHGPDHTIDGEACVLLEPANRGVGGRSIHAICEDRDLMALQEPLQLYNARSLAMRTFQLKRVKLAIRHRRMPVHLRRLSTGGSDDRLWGRVHLQRARRLLVKPCEELVRVQLGIAVQFSQVGQFVLQALVLIEGLMQTGAKLFDLSLEGRRPIITATHSK